MACDLDLEKGISNRRRALHTTFGVQANALLRKNLVLQRRAWGMNACLACFPVVLCVLIFVFQKLINNYMVNNEGATCGCQCLDKERGQSQTCSERDESRCGLIYSDSPYFCENRHPFETLPLLQLPVESQIRSMTIPLNNKSDTLLPEPERERVLANVSISYTAEPESLQNAKSIAKLLFEPMRSSSSFPSLANLLQSHGKSSLEVDDDKSNTTFLKAVSTVVLASDTPPEFGVQFREPALNYPTKPIYIMLNNCSSFLESAVNRNRNGNASDQAAATDLNFNLNLNPNPNPNLKLHLSVPFWSELVVPATGSTKSTMDGEKSATTDVQVRCVDVILNELVNSESINKKLFEEAYYSYKGGRGGGIESSSGLAYDFGKTGAKHFDLNVWFDESLAAFQINRPKKQLRLPRSLNAASNAFIRWAVNRSEAYAPLLYLKDMPKPATKLNIDMSCTLGPIFFSWVLQLLFPITIFNLVYEKEHNLRMMMRMHGLGDSAYWAISYMYFLVISVIYSALFVAFGSVVRLSFFVRNDYSVQFVFYFLVVNNTIALAFFVTPFFSSVKTAMVASYVYVFGMGLLGQFVFRLLWEGSDAARHDDRRLVLGMELLPAWAVFRGLLELSMYSSIAKYEGSDGLTWQSMSDPHNGMPEVLFILFAESFLFLALAFYMDKVVVTPGSGVRRHPLFLLDSIRKRTASRLKPELAAKSRSGRLLSLATVTRSNSVSVRPSPLIRKEAGAQEQDVYARNDDVIREREVVESARREGLVENGYYSIICDNLRKVYPGTRMMIGNQDQDKIAVKGLSLAIRRGECFGMLGPNGAGKTTSINMMIGFLSPTSGQGFIEGLSIEKDMDKIYGMMGVCPQHDLIWESLSAREHLRFFGRLKNLSDGKELEDAVNASLRSVDLFHGGVADKLSGEYSGGMKRRLSVAISLIGNPLVVYMDEPSTGLDPASRSNLWKVVKEARKERAIILTTHSMAEAEALCDRIGIIVGGEFRCIGAPKELTARYGGSFVFTITTPINEEKGAEKLAASLSPSARKVYRIAGTQKFEMPVAGIDIAEVFGKVEQAKKSLTILSWGIANTTLEDVFIKIAKAHNSESTTLSVS